MKSIINKWGTKPQTQATFVFDVLKDKMDDQEKERKIENFIAQINKYMKKISDELSIEKPITIMTARHSWASYAERKGVPLSYIQKQLSHTSLNTTINYLSSFHDDEHLQYQKLTTTFN
jgi:integrase/recombinase XerD